MCSNPPDAIQACGWMKSWSGSGSGWRCAQKTRGNCEVLREFEML